MGLGGGWRVVGRRQGKDGSGDGADVELQMGGRQGGSCVAAGAGWMAAAAGWPGKVWGQTGGGGGVALPAAPRPRLQAVRRGRRAGHGSTWKLPCAPAPRRPRPLARHLLACRPTSCAGPAAHVGWVAGSAAQGSFHVLPCTLSLSLSHTHHHTHTIHTHTATPSCLPLQITLRHFFEFAAFLCEMFVFAYLGLQVGWGEGWPHMRACSGLV